MFKSMKYFDVYYLCQVANNLLKGNFERIVNDFFEPFSESHERENSFKKYSLLHDFCEWVTLAEIWREDSAIFDVVRGKSTKQCLHHKGGALWVDFALNYHCKNSYDFLSWLAKAIKTETEDMQDSEIEELRLDYLRFVQDTEDFDNCLTQIVDEMFFVLFQNREFLHSFNSFLARYNNIKKKRIPFPQWVKRAVFFRDRGKCVFCGKDLSGLQSIPENNSIHFDHIVSLSANGINDISNLQLACQNCNLEKGRNCHTSFLYQQWYDRSE